MQPDRTIAEAGFTCEPESAQAAAACNNADPSKKSPDAPGVSFHAETALHRGIVFSVLGCAERFSPACGR